MKYSFFPCKLSLQINEMIAQNFHEFPAFFAWSAFRRRILLGPGRVWSQAEGVGGYRQSHHDEGVSGGCELDMEVSIYGGYPFIAGWFVRESPIKIWMMTRGRPISVNHHMDNDVDMDVYHNWNGYYIMVMIMIWMIWIWRLKSWN